MDNEKLNDELLRIQRVYDQEQKQKNMAAMGYPPVHVVGNNNTVNVPDETQRFEQRCWELFVASRKVYAGTLDLIIEAVQEFEAKMKELQDESK